MSQFDTIHEACSKLAASNAGESVLYTPSGGSETTIKAIIYRDGYLVEGEGNVEQLVHDIVIVVAKTEITTVTTGADIVKIKRRSTDSATTELKIQQILSEIGGMWTLIVR